MVMNGRYYCPYPWLPRNGTIAEDGSADPIDVVAVCVVNLGKDVLGGALIAFQGVAICIWFVLLFCYLFLLIAAHVRDGQSTTTIFQKRIMSIASVFATMQIASLFLHPSLGIVPYQVSVILDAMSDILLFNLGLQFVELWGALTQSDGKFVPVQVIPTSQRALLVIVSIVVFLVLHILQLSNVCDIWCVVARDMGTIVLAMMVLLRCSFSAYAINQTIRKHLLNAKRSTPSSSTHMPSELAHMDYEEYTLEITEIVVAMEKVERVKRIMRIFNIKFVLFGLVVVAVAAMAITSLLTTLIHGKWEPYYAKANYSDGIENLPFYIVHLTAGIVAAAQFWNVSLCKRLLGNYDDLDEPQAEASVVKDNVVVLS